MSTVDPPSEPPAARALPPSRRGQATRAVLIAAARTVFERIGFLDAKIVDIVDQAGVATGSFYTYFDDKDEILRAVLSEVREEMLHPGDHNAPSGGDERPAALIERANRRYLESYRENAQLMRLLEQVAQVDPAFAEFRRDRARAFAQRNARSIERLQDAGLADRTLDPYLASVALSSMVSRTAYSVFVSHTYEIEFEPLVKTLTQLWLSALRIADPA